MTPPREPTEPSALDDGLHHDGVDDGPTGQAVTRRRRTALLAGAAVIAAAVVIIGIVLISTRGAGPTAEPSGADSSAPSSSEAAADPASGEPEADGASETPSATGDSPADREQPPVELGASPVLSEGVTLRVESLAAVDGEAALPGEVGGPAVAATIVVDNASSAPLDLSSVVVNAYSGDAVTPANPLSTGTISFPTAVAPGTAATATYVFAVPADERDQVRVTVDTSVDLPTIVFEGAAS